MSRIALDAMGGDNAPREMVRGALDAAADGVDVVLVGDRDAIRPILIEEGADLDVVHAPDTVGMGDDPARAIRQKPDSSVAQAARLVHTGEASGFVSAGSTGAALAAGVVLVGRIPGVKRPSIATIWPTPPTPTVVVDSGANPDVKPAHLLQFAQMGHVAAQVFLGMDRPRIGLLSNGEEKGKGRNLERAAYELLEQSGLEFVGNVEGRDVGRDRADVMVTDGFTGNVFLKAVEGAASMVASLAMETLSGLDADVAEPALGALMDLRTRMDPETYGGGHLLGVAGVVVVAHGSSRARSITNALRMARDGADHDLVGLIGAEVAAR